MVQEDNFAHLVKQDFEVLETIGAGGMGVVYKAKDANLEKIVAIKALPSHLSGLNLAARFKKEMQNLAKLRHQAIVQVHSGRSLPNGQLYYVMDYVEGTDLAHLIAQRQQQNRPFTVEETVELLQPIAEALDYLHFEANPRIIHRDIKPANILVPADSDSPSKSLLTDFGISLSTDTTSYSDLSLQLGTPNYVPPEFYQPTSTPSESGDNYALALIAYEMLSLDKVRNTMSTTGWQTTNRMIPNIRSTMPPGLRLMGRPLQRVFARALDTIPARRYRKATDFIRALQSADPRRYRMRVGVWGTATAVIAVALVAGTMILHHPTDAGRQTSRSSTTWPEEQAQVAKVFPELLPAGPDDTGWDGMKCQAVANSQRLGLDCANYRQRVWVYRYNSQEDRDAMANFSHNENRWVLNGVKCNAEVLLSDSGDEALLLPKEDLSEFAILVQARDAKRTLEQLPICT